MFAHSWFQALRRRQQNLLTRIVRKFFSGPIEASLREAKWSPNGCVTLKGWAYQKSINLDRVEVQIHVALVSKFRRVNLAVERCEMPEVNLDSNHGFYDYSKSGFQVVIDPDKLLQGTSTTKWFVEITITSSKGRVTTRLHKFDDARTAFNAGIGTTPGGTQLRIIPDKRDHVVIEVSRPMFTAYDLHARGNGLAGRVMSAEATPDNVKCFWEDDPKTLISSTPLQSDGSRSWSFYLPLDQPSLSDGWDKNESRSLVIRVSTDTGDYPIAWPETPRTALEPIGSTGVAFSRNSEGNLALYSCAGILLAVDDLDLTSDGLLLSGHGISSERDVEIILWNGEVVSVGSVVWDHDNWSSLLPLTTDQWGQGTRVLPSGTYQIGAVFKGIDPCEAATRGVVFGPGIGYQLPMKLKADTCQASFELTELRYGQVVVEPPLFQYEHAKRVRHLMRENVPNLGKKGLQEDTILLSCYYGEVATCNPYGVHRAIQTMGTDLRVLWGVMDYSVAIPEGGTPVIIDSQEWYKALATSKFSLWNVHQPFWYRKNPGQIMVETFHGYPFKRAGMDHWHSMGLSHARIKSFLERHTEWNYLVSPSPYATPLLAKCFPGAQAMLEIGYPRNDVFFDPDRDKIRARVRAILQIPDEAIAVLYAPTFRDWLSDGETIAQVANVLSPAELSSRLSPDYVILMRGHPMEGRGGETREGGARVIDVTAYPQVEELCLASDIGLLDYSSLRFDYALTGNPMIFFVPDLERYLTRERGSLIPYEGTAPGPWCKTIDELVEVLKDPSGLRTQYRDVTDQFIRDFLPLEDGHAGERLVNTLLNS